MWFAWFFGGIAAAALLPFLLVGAVQALVYRNVPQRAQLLTTYHLVSLAKTYLRAKPGWWNLFPLNVGALCWLGALGTAVNLLVTPRLVAPAGTPPHTARDLPLVLTILLTTACALLVVALLTTRRAHVYLLDNHLFILGPTLVTGNGIAALGFLSTHVKLQTPHPCETLPDLLLLNLSHTTPYRLVLPCPDTLRVALIPYLTPTPPSAPLRAY